MRKVGKIVVGTLLAGSLGLGGTYGVTKHNVNNFRDALEAHNATQSEQIANYFKGNWTTGQPDYITTDQRDEYIKAINTALKRLRMRMNNIKGKEGYALTQEQGGKRKVVRIMTNEEDLISTLNKIIIKSYNNGKVAN